MGNRRHHKKLRADVRARMARTGESYQRALSQILATSKRSPTPAPRVDLTPIDWFGADAALATIENMGVTLFFVVGTGTRGSAMPVRVPPWARPRP